MYIQYVTKTALQEFKWLYVVSFILYLLGTFLHLNIISANIFRPF